MTAKKEIVKNEVVKNEVETLPSFMKAGGQRGQENVGIDDLSIPRLDVIQALSPQRKKTAPEYIEGADEGMLFNNVTGQLYGNEVVFVPVFFRKEWLVWKDRKQGGGFGGAFPTERDANNECAKLGEAYESSETAVHFGFVLDGEGDVVDEVVISMARSKLKASRQLNTLARIAGGDRFSSQYKVSAVEVAGEKGDYFNLHIKRVGFVTEPVYRAAEKLYESIASGSRDVNRSYDEEVAEGEDAPY